MLPGRIENGDVLGSGLGAGTLNIELLGREEVVCIEELDPLRRGTFPAEIASMTGPRF